MSTPICILLIILAAIAGAVAGFAFGQWRGRAIGWVEHYIETEQAKRERRDRHGRFVASKVNGRAAR